MKYGMLRKTSKKCHQHGEKERQQCENKTIAINIYWLAAGVIWICEWPGCWQDISSLESPRIIGWAWVQSIRICGMLGFIHSMLDSWMILKKFPRPRCSASEFIKCVLVILIKYCFSAIYPRNAFRSRIVAEMLCKCYSLDEELWIVVEPNWRK